MADKKADALEALANNRYRQRQLDDEIARIIASGMPHAEKLKQIDKLQDENDEIIRQSDEILSSLTPESLARPPTADLPLLQRCTDRGVATIRLAASLTIHGGKSDVEPQDMLAALHNGGGVSELALRDTGHVKPALPTQLPQADDQFIETSPLVRLVIETAENEAGCLRHSFIGSEHLLLAIVRLYPGVVSDADQVRSAVFDILGN